MPALPLKSLQEYFDATWNHHIVNKQPPGYGPEYGCCYRGPNGEKCAIGVSIPDENYRSYLEGTIMEKLLFDIGQQPTEGEDKLVKSLESLQVVHDQCAKVAANVACYESVEALGHRKGDTFHSLYERNLRAFATKEGLTIPGGQEPS